MYSLRLKKQTGRDLCKIPFPPTAEIQTQVFGCFLPRSLLILPKYPLNPPRIPDNQAYEPSFRRQQAHLACWRISKVQTHTFRWLCALTLISPK
ncbi:hypothetical protein HMPREF3156_02572 [Neisseria sp. HMSC06F02]|nr:hypothetical protein HMPREF3156_02572 [Neisseria sp. HMSC06F02]